MSWDLFTRTSGYLWLHAQRAESDFSILFAGPVGYWLHFAHLANDPQGMHKPSFTSHRTWHTSTPHWLPSRYNPIWVITEINVKKDKAIPVTGRVGPLGCETSRFPHFLDNWLKDGGEVVSLTRRPILCDCEATAYLWFRHLGQFFMKASDFYDAPIFKILHFIRSVGLIKG
jgi:hypothetical protein